MKKKFKNNENGITLFALIVTIIVMLIISGVTIKRLDESRITSFSDDISDFSRDIIKGTDAQINTTNNNWTNVIHQNGIEKPMENGIRKQ